MGPLISAQRLLDAVRALHEQQADRQRAELREAFTRLRRGWDEIRLRRRMDAPSHNLIRFLGFQRKEVAFHSPFLCDLLNPNGTHDQGTVFLQGFLQLLNSRARSSASKWDYQWRDVDTSEAAQWLVLAERGRIDISIRNRSEGVLIFIENKIGAAEQCRQITRIREQLDAEQKNYPRRLLVFLAPKAYGPPGTGKPDICLTYEEDIAAWIETAEDKIPDTAVSLRGNLRQYRLVARAVSGVAMMPNQGLIDLIVKPENLPWALEIEAAMSDAKTHLLRTFWAAIGDALEARLSALGLATAFRIEGSSRFERDPRTNRAHVQLGVFHEDKKIFPGVAFSHRQPYPSPLSEVRALTEVLPEHWRNSNDYWVGYHDLGYRMDAPDFLQKLAQDAMAIAQSLTEQLADVLRNQFERVRNADRALQTSPMI